MVVGLVLVLEIFFGLILVFVLIQLFSFSFSPYFGLVNIPAMQYSGLCLYLRV